MDMDFKPASPPPSAPAPQAPLITPTPPLQEDPFKPDTQPPVLPNAPVAKAPKAKKSRKGLKVFFLIVLVLVLIGGVGYGTFYWQHQHVTSLISERGDLNGQIGDLQTQVATLNSENAKLTASAKPAATATAAPTNDEQVVTAVTAYCQSAVDPTTAKALVYSTDKKPLYSSDKTYASLTATCAPTANAPNASKTYYLKHTGTSWVVLYGAQAVDPAMVKLYAIPTTFN